MPFPESPRILYGKNPLVEVICQLRFPPILRIDSELPAVYQERIRHQYPLFRQARTADQQLGVPKEIAHQLGIDLAQLAPGASYEFVSADENWTVSLTRNFLALATRRYERWEQFGDQLKGPIESLIDVYKPAFFTRIGLRYKDLIQRSVLGLDDTPWSELLQTYITGELSTSDVAPDIEEAVRLLLIRLEDERGRVRIQHGLAEETTANETCYLIDSDFFLEHRTEISDATSTLDYFNHQARRLFHWFITARLHEAMDPQDIT
jgi:uncharacterized protein (TIGR04255 family)